MTYQEAYDLIIEAYFKDEIRPLDAKFCFCGTLAGNNIKWFVSPRTKHNDFGNYKGIEYVRMEDALLGAMKNVIFNRSSPFYEEFLFEGMCAALEVLKDIHRSRGEDVDCRPALKKRKLNKVL
jgi:hypothetical protein